MVFLVSFRQWGGVRLRDRDQSRGLKCIRPRPLIFLDEPDLDPLAALNRPRARSREFDRDLERRFRSLIRFFEGSDEASGFLSPR